MFQPLSLFVFDSLEVCAAARAGLARVAALDMYTFGSY